jgi:hypothetical protein
MPRVEIVHPNMVDVVWPHIGEGMAKSCRSTGNKITAGWLWQECRSGRAFLIAAYDETVLGAAIVQFVDNGQALEGLGLCGTRCAEWWDDMTEAVKTIMRHGDCALFIDNGRPAMAKYFPDAVRNGSVFEVRIS